MIPSKIPACASCVPVCVFRNLEPFGVSFASSRSPVSRRRAGHPLVPAAQVLAMQQSHLQPLGRPKGHVKGHGCGKASPRLSCCRGFTVELDAIGVGCNWGSFFGVTLPVHSRSSFPSTVATIHWTRMSPVCLFFFRVCSFRIFDIVHRCSSNPGTIQSC